jgi:hypothetical protein
VQNISTGGLALITEMRLATADRLRLALTFPGEASERDVEVEVREAKRLVTREYLVHCAFASLSPQVQKTIAAWNEARGPEASAAAPA